MSPRRKGRNVYPLPGGRWLARLWRGGELHKAAFATRLEAEQYRDAVDLDWRLRTRGLPGIVHQRPLLLDLVARFLAAAERRGLAPATLAYYRYTLAGWERFVRDELGRPGLPADEVDDRLVARYARQGKPAERSGQYEGVREHDAERGPERAALPEVLHGDLLSGQ